MRFHGWMNPKAAVYFHEDWSFPVGDADEVHKDLGWQAPLKDREGHTGYRIDSTFMIDIFDRGSVDGVESETFSDAVSMAIDAVTTGFGEYAPIDVAVVRVVLSDLQAKVPGLAQLEDEPLFIAALPGAVAANRAALRSMYKNDEQYFVFVDAGDKDEAYEDLDNLLVARDEFGEDE